MSPRLTAFLVCALLCATASTARAADEAAVLRLRAEQLAAEDRCEDALARLQRARELAPAEDARAALVEGRCSLRLNRYESAIEPLETARRLDPGIAGISIDLAMAHFHRADYPAAERELALAEQEMPDDPRVSLYRGLLLLQQKEDAEAAAALARAGRMDRRLDPLASYYAGLAWERARDRDQAKEALERVEREAPGSDWAQQAALALDRLDAPYQRHWWADIAAGMGYDSNVALSTSDISGLITPEAIFDESDGFGYWSAQGGYEFLSDPDWSLGAMVGYDGDAHFDLNQFNLQSPRIDGWIQRRIDEKSYLALQPYFAYAWFEGKPYLGTGGGNLSYYRNYDGSTGRLFGVIDYNDFLFPVLGDSGLERIIELLKKAPPVNIDLDALIAQAGWLETARNRDGLFYRAGYEHLIEFTETTDVRAGVDYHHYESDGSEFIHDHVGIWLGLYQDLPWKFTLEVLGSYAYEPYRFPSTFTFDGWFNRGPRRRDNVWRVGTLLERPIREHVKASINWRYHNNDSNTTVYNFDRHIVGGHLTVTFGG
jgi:tetratricopeptide (TPR) repeat protein